jgi:RND family efflux transporter MFP subunit
MNRTIPLSGGRPPLRTVIAALVCAAALPGCGTRGSKTPTAAASMTVTVGSASSQKIAQEIVASGSVAAWQEMSLGVELSGIRVSQVLVEVGTAVRAGQTLVQLDARTLSIQARQADAGVAQARANLELARASAARGDSLLAQKLISNSNFETLRADLSRAEAQLTSAAAERDAARLRLGFASLRAPDDGIISARSVQPGQVVSAGAELLRLIRRGRLEWRAEVSDNDLIRIKPGAVVELGAPDGSRVSGRVRAVSPSINPQTRTALIYADLPQPGALRAGMFAEGHLRLGESPALVLPREAVLVRDGYSYVFVLGAGSKVAQRRVEVGSAQDATIAILSGLRPDEKVAISGAGFLGDGDLVRVVPGR